MVSLLRDMSKTDLDISQSKTGCRALSLQAEKNERVNDRQSFKQTRAEAILQHNRLLDHVLVFDYKACAR